MRRFILLAPMVALLFVSACGDDDSGGGGDVPLDQVVQAYVHAYCEALVRCPPSGAMVASFDGDAEVCYDYLSIFLRESDLQKFEEAVGEGRMSYDPSLGGDCVEAIRNVACEEVLVGLNDPPQPCEDVFAGFGADGTTCSYDEECVSGWCDMSVSCPGTCAAPVAENGDCSSGQRCAQGLACVDGTCVSDPGPAGNGEPCDVRDCAYGLYCDYNATNPVCASRGGRDAACDDDEQCDYGLVCTDDGVCVEPTVVGSGEACDPQTGLLCSLAEGLSCAMDVMGETFTTCEPFRQENEACLEGDAQGATYYACDPLAHLYCDMDFQNFTGVCVAQKADGSACEQDEECLSSWCNENGVCESFSGDPCN